LIQLLALPSILSLQGMVYLGGIPDRNFSKLMSMTVHCEHNSTATVYDLSIELQGLLKCSKYRVEHAGHRLEEPKFGSES